MLRVDVATKLVLIMTRVSVQADRKEPSRKEFVAEQQMIGAVLILGAKDARARKWLDRITGYDFNTPIHSWLWGQLRKGRAIGVPMIRECRLKFRMSLGRVVLACLDSGFWWHGDFYAEQVLAASAKRERKYQ